VFYILDIILQLHYLIYNTIAKNTWATRRNRDPDYFKKVLWPSYLLHNKPLLEIFSTWLFVVDGTRSKAQVFHC
jgi:hypothetical protein